jgi:hypothetical protein
MPRPPSFVWWVTSLLGATLAWVGIRTVRRRAHARRPDVGAVSEQWLADQRGVRDDGSAY